VGGIVICGQSPSKRLEACPSHWTRWSFICSRIYSALLTTPKDGFAPPPHALKGPWRNDPSRRNAAIPFPFHPSTDIFDVNTMPGLDVDVFERPFDQGSKTPSLCFPMFFPFFSCFLTSCRRQQSPCRHLFLSGLNTASWNHRRKCGYFRCCLESDAAEDSCKYAVFFLPVFFPAKSTECATDCLGHWYPRPSTALRHLEVGRYTGPVRLRTGVNGQGPAHGERRLSTPPFN